MQNLNDLNKLQQMQKMQQMQTVQQIPNTEGEGKPAPSKYNKFVNFVWLFFFIPFLIFAAYIMISDNNKTKKQIQVNVEAIMNSPKMQSYRAKEARRQRELAKKRRLKQLGIDGISKPMQKNDLLNQQIRKQEIAEEEEKIESQRPQGVDYTSELATYNARLKEVRAEEARLVAEAQAAARAQAEARAQAAREQAEQLRLEREQQAQEQRFLAQEQARQKAEEQARLAQEKAEKERAAKIKAAQEKAAQAAKLKAQVEALKTQRNTLNK